MASKIVPLIPKHTVYVEPFCGGASVFFKKPWPNVNNKDHYREILNDIDEHLIKLYRIAIERPKALYKKIITTPHSEALYSKSKWVLQYSKGFSDLDIAWAYYVNIQQGFSNRLFSSWRRSVYSRNESVTWINKIKNLPEVLERMSGVHISCTDALTCIKQWDSPQTFFYCDPPYPNADQGHYSGYTLDDFQNLVDTLDQCQGSFMLSNYNQEIIFPSDWERFEFNSYCSASAKGRVRSDRSRKATKEELGNIKRTEVLWRRLNKVPVRKEIQKLYDSGKFDCFAKCKRQMSLNETLL